ncbi:FAD synthase-like [Periplaneta americana]|uniref:FAD synthase-like n=1 Tax=Periplaneta americana TaxID=6978 RepID=UPI0037E836B7
MLCKMASHTAGIIVIGDEILKGQIVDTNSHFLCKRLHSLGIKVCKISVVGDDIEEIASEVANFSQKYNNVFTSGGVGPTHDDVTYLGVARAFGRPVEVNKEIAKILLDVNCVCDIKDIDSNPALKIAQIPLQSNLIYLKPKERCFDSSVIYPSTFPVVKVENVYIFPGIPKYFEYAVTNLEHLLKNPDGDKFYTQELYLSSGELDIVPVLNLAVEKFKGSVVFGSYPELGNDIYVTKITLESTSSQHVEEAETYLRMKLPAGTVVDPLEEGVYTMMKQGSMKGLPAAITTAVKVIEECFDKFNPSEVFISFNGGKDCTALLHLASAVMRRKFPCMKKSLYAVYIKSRDPFPQVEEFIEESVKRYNLDLKTVPGPIKHALGDILNEKPQLKAVLMGTRRTDPYSESLNSFQMTDETWPQVMRVSPLLDWTYQDVWTFLRDLSVPYCCLYDEGYTSLGNRHNTAPNPALSYVDTNGTVHYCPAYTLQDGTSERNGRH